MAVGARLADRSLFADLRAQAYLNHAAISAPSTRVRGAVGELLADYAARGMAAYGTWAKRREELRAKLAHLVGAAAEEIGFVQSTTMGLLALALSIPFRKGERIVLFEGEFPANVTPWQRVAQRFGLEVAFVPLSAFERSDDEGLALTRRALEQGARLVAVSAVQFQTGLRMPLDALAALAHEHGAELCVDAVQALGVVPLDVRALGIDYLACGSHKWLMGLEGAGFVFVQRERLEALEQTFAGWLSHENAVAFLFGGPGLLRYDRAIRRRADFVEVGNLSAASFAALDASLSTLLELDVERIFAHVAAYLDELEPAVTSLGLASLRATEPSRRSGMLCVEIPAAVEALALQRAMADRGVACSIPDGRLRFAPHFWNDPSEIDDVRSALAHALRELGLPAQ